MFQRLLRVLYVIEFLVAVIAIFHVWSELGGAHLDYMAWYWKAAIGLPAAYVVVRITMAMVSDDAKRVRRMIAWGSVLVLLAVSAGLVTYYYHLNEPQDEENQDQQTVTPAALRVVGTPSDSGAVMGSVCRCRRLPAVPRRGVCGAVGDGACAVARSVEASAAG